MSNLKNRSSRQSHSNAFTARRISNSNGTLKRSISLGDDYRKLLINHGHNKKENIDRYSSKWIEILSEIPE